MNSTKNSKKPIKIESKQIATIINIFKISIQDFLSSPFLGMTILPFVITTMLLFGIFLYFGGEFFQLLMQDNGADLSFINPQEHPWLASILAFSFVKWIVVTFFYLIGGAFVILISVIVATIIIGFFTPRIVRVIRERHYPDIELKEGFSISKLIWIYAKIFLAFIGLSLLCIPLLLLPGVNLVIFNIPFYYLFHNLLVLDVVSNINTEEEFKIIKEKKRGQLYLATMIFYLMSLIPLVGMIGTVFFIITLSHIVFLATREIRTQN